MTVRPLLLTAVAAICATCASGADNVTTSSFVSAYEASITPTAAVSASDRVSADQQFAKTWDIRGNTSKALSAFMLDLPGRVFFSHADSKLSGDALARIKVSGDTETIVNNIQVFFNPSGLPTADESITIKRDVLDTKKGALLVEIELARRNSLRTLTNRGNGDAVLLENVLYSSDHDALYNSSSTMYQEVATTIGAGNGKVFVSDKAGSVVMNSFRLNGEDGNVQVELASLRTIDVLEPFIIRTGNVTLFVNELHAKLKIELGRNQASGFVCIADVSSKSNTSLVFDGAAERLSHPGQQTRPFACTKQAIPERVPVNTEGSSSTSAGVALEGLRAATFAVTGLVSLLLATAF